MPLFGPPDIEKLKATGNIKGLIKALNYKKDATIRQTAAQALVEMGHARDAVESLDKLGWQPDKSEVGAAYWVAKRQWDKCVEIGAPAVEPLGTAFKDGNARVRLSVVNVLGKIDDARAIELLVTALGDDVEYVRKNATESLVEIGAPAVEPLIAALKNDNVSLVAAEVLGEIGDTQAVEPLIAALKDDKVSHVAAQALGKIGDVGAVEPLITALKEGGFKRLFYAQALGEIGDARAVEPLIATLKDIDDTMIGQMVIMALGEIGDARAVEPLIATLKDIDNPLIGSAVITALGEIGDARAVEPLVAALATLKEYNFFIVSSAGKALDRLGWQPDKSRVGALYWIAKKQCDKCIEIGSPAVEPLSIALENGILMGKSMPRAAAYALGNIGDARAVKALETACFNASRDVSQAASEALRKIR
jgi:HEAT repeat protein